MYMPRLPIASDAIKPTVAPMLAEVTPSHPGEGVAYLRKIGRNGTQGRELTIRDIAETVRQRGGPDHLVCSILYQPNFWHSDNINVIGSYEIYLLNGLGQARSLSSVGHTHHDGSGQDFASWEHRKGGERDGWYAQCGIDLDKMSDDMLGRLKLGLFEMPGVATDSGHASIRERADRNSTRRLKTEPRYIDIDIMLAVQHDVYGASYCTEKRKELVVKIAETVATLKNKTNITVVTTSGSMDDSPVVTEPDVKELADLRAARCEWACVIKGFYQLARLAHGTRLEDGLMEHMIADAQNFGEDLVVLTALHVPQRQETLRAIDYVTKFAAMRSLMDPSSNNAHLLAETLQDERDDLQAERQIERSKHRLGPLR